MAKRTSFIGEMDTEISVYRVVHNTDDYGGQPRRLELKGDSWASVKINRNSFAGEDQRNYKNTSIVNYNLVVRNNPDFEIVYTDVIRYSNPFGGGDTLLYVKNVNPKDQRGFYYEIKARSTSPKEFVLPSVGLYTQVGESLFSQTGDNVFNQLGV